MDIRTHMAVMRGAPLAPVNRRKARAIRRLYRSTLLSSARKMSRESRRYARDVMGITVTASEALKAARYNLHEIGPAVLAVATQRRGYPAEVSLT